MTIQQIVFIVFALIITAGGVGVLVQRNPLYSAFSLILSFIGLAAMYILMGAQFLGVIQIVVYAGAIMVLFVFVIMLLNVRDDELHPDRHKYLLYIGVPLGLGLIAEVFYVVTRVQIAPAITDMHATGTVGTVERIGVGLLTEYLLPFEATSVLILMAVIGAMHLAKREKE
ncbi:MAG: NADH-quinone oxidoreductase subunit J [Blastocatellia bacterium]|nr:NADH-quinone oxidoreductase subunit J [Blastocatellia bacterium]